MHGTIEKVLNITFVVVLAFGLLFGLSSIGPANFSWFWFSVALAVGVGTVGVSHVLHRHR
jgi:hypothetical protein